MIIKNKAVKTILKILLIIAIAVIVLVITFYAVVYFVVIKGQENFEKEYVGKPNHITSLSDLENVKFDLDEFIMNGTRCDLYHTEYHYYESDAENLFIDFAGKNKYLFLQKYFDEKNVVYLLDENAPAVYIYGQYFS